MRGTWQKTQAVQLFSPNKSRPVDVNVIQVSGRPVNASVTKQLEEQWETKSSPPTIHEIRSSLKVREDKEKLCKKRFPIDPISHKQIFHSNCNFYVSQLLKGELLPFGRVCASKKGCFDPFRCAFPISF